MAVSLRFRMAQLYSKYVNNVFSNTGVCMAPDNYDALLQRLSPHVATIDPGVCGGLQDCYRHCVLLEVLAAGIVYEDMVLEVLHKNYRQRDANCWMRSSSVLQALLHFWTEV